MMKHKNLKDAIAYAAQKFLSVKRSHRHNGFSGLTTVEIKSHDGSIVAEKCYTIGNASAQADFIKKTAKGYRFIENGKMYRYSNGVDVFKSDQYGTVYAWNSGEMAWQVIRNFDPETNRYLAPVILKVKVNVMMFQHGIQHPDW